MATKKRVLSRRWREDELPDAAAAADVFVVRWSPDGALLAAGCEDGTVNILSAADGATLASLPGSSDLPVTAIRFRPGRRAGANTLLVGSADGAVRHFAAETGKCLHKIVEKGNQVFALDYRSDGYFFATAGRDKTVRVYDEAARAVVATSTDGQGDETSGHSNRIFAVKFHPADNNLLVSAGWDNTAQIHDIRVGAAVRCIFGPHVCGDAVDVTPDGATLLTGSWRADDALQLWDLGTGKLMETVSWGGGGGGAGGPTTAAPGKGGAPPPPPTPTLLYAAAFSKEGGAALIAAGGSGTNEARVFERGRGDGAASLVGVIGGLPRAVFSLDFLGDGAVAIAGGDAPVRVYDFVAAATAALRAEEMGTPLTVDDFSSVRAPAPAPEGRAAVRRGVAGGGAATTAVAARDGRAAVPDVLPPQLRRGREDDSAAARG